MENKDLFKILEDYARESIDDVEAIAAINQHIYKEVVEARIEENQIYLDNINNYKPDPSAPRLGSASGAIETAGWKHAFEDRIETLKNLEGK